jgi:DNA-binding transcriptional LysR family regulator
MDISQKRLRTVHAIVRCGSLKAAAAAVGISPSTVSLHISELEATLKVRLFHRTTRGLKLTEAGQFLVERTRAPMEELRSVANDLLQQSRLQGGRVCFACLPTLSALVMPAAMVAFQKRYPDVIIRLIDQPTTGAEQAVLNGTADFGLVNRPAYPGALNYKNLLRDRLVAIVPADSKLAQKEHVTLEELAVLDLVCMRENTSSHQAISDAFRRRNLPFRPVHSFARPGTVLGIVGAGIGVGLLPETAMAGLKSAEHKIVTIRPTIARDLGVIQRAGEPLSRQANELLIFVKRALAAASRPYMQLSGFRD